MFLVHTHTHSHMHIHVEYIYIYIHVYVYILPQHQKTCTEVLALILTDRGAKFASVSLLINLHHLHPVLLVKK